jgi:hypothetical protein
MEVARLIKGNSKGRRSRVLFVLVMLLPLSGCTGAVDPVITTGSYKSLPRPGTSLMISSRDPEVRGTVARWLQDRELAVVGMEKSEAEPCENCTTDQLLAQARRLNAEQIVLFDITKPHQADRRLLSIRGLSLVDGTELWSGTAWSWLPPDVSTEELQRERVLLACHALATVWRFRPAGIPLNRSIDPCYYRP